MNLRQQIFSCLFQREKDQGLLSFCILFDHDECNFARLLVCVISDVTIPQIGNVNLLLLGVLLLMRLMERLTLGVAYFGRASQQLWKLDSSHWWSRSSMARLSRILNALGGQYRYLGSRKQSHLLWTPKPRVEQT